MYQYRVHHRGAERLELRVGWFWRVFFLACCAFLAWAAFHGGDVYPLPAVMGIICLVAGLYNERWAFDRNAGQVVSYVGLFPIVRRRVYDLQSVTAVRVLTSAPIGGSAPEAKRDHDSGPYTAPGVPRVLQRRLVRLSLRMRQDGDDALSVNMQTESQRRHEHLLMIGRAVADFCRVPLETFD
ncbi:MAG: hypothetical protein EA384_07540 [Spirochaetaceae bacterium]|nr:MAG: hypothetical protein EA384_07540 [Spirochaetaceae bacterium]